MNLSTERSRQHRAYITAEVGWPVGTDAPEAIATRLGYSHLDGLVCVLRKWGRADLADKLKPPKVNCQMITAATTKQTGRQRPRHDHVQHHDDCRLPALRYLRVNARRISIPRGIRHPSRTRLSGNASTALKCTVPHD